MKYIDADRLIAEIERYENTAIDAYNPLGEDADFWHGKVVACEDLKTFVTSLKQEQPEVDLEKEYTEFVVSDPVYSKLVNGIVGKSIARHFYELGINARKEE